MGDDVPYPQPPATLPGGRGKFLISLLALTKNDTRVLTKKQPAGVGGNHWGGGGGPAAPGSHIRFLGCQ